MKKQLFSTVALMVMASVAFAGPSVRPVEKVREKEELRNGNSGQVEATGKARTALESQRVGEAVSELARAKASCSTASCSQFADILIAGTVNPGSKGLDAAGQAKVASTVVQFNAIKGSTNLTVDDALSRASQATKLDREAVEESCK